MEQEQEQEQQEQPKVVAIVYQNGAVQFSGEEFTQGAILDAAQRLLNMVRNRVIRPEQQTQQVEGQGE